MAKVHKIINDPENIVDEVLDGLVAISRGLLARDPGSRVIRRTEIDEGKVGLVVGGGSGHEQRYLLRSVTYCWKVHNHQYPSLFDVFLLDFQTI